MMRKLDLSKQHSASDSIDLLIKKISTNQNLKILTLKENHIGLNELKRVIEMLATLTITEIDLSSNEINNEALTEFSQELYRNVLQRLNLRFNKFNDLHRFTCDLAINRSLTQLDLSHNNLTTKNIQHLFDALVLNITLKKLYLDKTCLNDMSGVIIAKYIMQNYALKILSLNDNQLTDESVVKLAIALRENTHLTILNIKGNKFSNSSLIEFFYTYKFNKNLVKINLMNNNISKDIPEIAKKVIALTEKTKNSVNLNSDLLAQIEFHKEFIRYSLNFLIIAKFLFLPSTSKSGLLSLPPIIKLHILSIINSNFKFLTKKQVLSATTIFARGEQNNTDILKMTGCNKIMRPFSFFKANEENKIELKLGTNSALSPRDPGGM